MKKTILFFYLLLGLTVCLQSQTATVFGKLKDAQSGQALEVVLVYVDGTSEVVESNGNGNYEIQVPSGKSFRLVFSRLGYETVNRDFSAMPLRSRRRVDIALAPEASGLEVVVRETQLENEGMIVEDLNAIKLLPTTTGNLESALPHIALGTTAGAGGELSSQYQVRGGNYDENLVYVNDFEIYRPQLIRSGQQEGLTFPNPDLVSTLSFSSGGFEAKYGDKLSSVLDIKYKRPDSLAGSVMASLLGASGHVEGAVPLSRDGYRKFRFLAGARYKTTRYLLGGLDITGEYVPNFADIQAYLTFDLNRNWQLGILGNYNRSIYQFVPNERSTAFGLINFALELFTVFEGQEVTDFETAMGGVSLTYIPDRSKNPYFLKFMGSGFTSDENETFDIIGDYSLRQIEADLGSSQFGEVLAELGTGTQQEFVRNFLDVQVYNAEHRGGVEFQVLKTTNRTKTHFLQWSAKFQHETIRDQINEWERLDSAGYSLPFSQEEVLLFEVVKSKNNLESIRLSGFLQETFTWRTEGVGEFKGSVGVRFSWWDLNQELLISPRGQLLYKPLSWKTDISFRFSAGIYAQPPFYRELRRLDGTLNLDLRAQKSAHVVGGLTWDFFLGNNPKKFRFISEIYYKHLWDLVSYEIENVRIRYSGENDATGYVAGIDFRLNGEFVPGAESWINLSILTARERLDGVQHQRRERGEEEGVPVNSVPRPTDRRISLAVYFQDYLPNNDNFKLKLNMILGSGLPFGFPENNTVFRNTYRLRPYYRVDIGFAVALFEPGHLKKHPNHFLRFSRGTWLSFEVFNLLGVQNQSGNTWIKTIFEQQYAIPNNLTSRRFNLRFRMDI